MPLPVAGHFHDTRGLGLANVLAALNAGARAFDASLGGLGGCPYAPGATGDIVTEDLVFMLEAIGFETGIDIERLLEVRELVHGFLPNVAQHGAIAEAGAAQEFPAGAAGASGRVESAGPWLSPTNASPGSTAGSFVRAKF